MNYRQRELALQDLDKHAFEYNFPVFDNVHVAFAAAKLSIFSGTESWAIAFEVLGYTRNLGSFENWLYAYGNCLSTEGILTADVILSEDPESLLTDPQTQAWIADWSSWSVNVNNQKFHFQPSQDDYSKIGIVVPKEAGPGSLREKDILRYFIAKQGTGLLFRTHEQLVHNLKGCSGMQLLLETCEWEHPDVAGGELPSQSVSIRSVLSTIEQRSSHAFVFGKVNSHWQDWDNQNID